MDKFMAKIEFEFIVYTEKEWQPEKLDEFLKLEPGVSKIEKKGTPGKYISSLKENSWIYSTGPIEANDLLMCSEMLLNTFGNHVQEISEYVKSENLKSILYIIIYMTKTEIPEMHIDKRILHFLDELDSCFSFDLYFFSKQYYKELSCQE